MKTHDHLERIHQEAEVCAVELWTCTIQFQEIPVPWQVRLLSPLTRPRQAAGIRPSSLSQRGRGSHRILLKSQALDIHSHLVRIGTGDIIWFPFLVQWLGFESMEIWDLGPVLPAGVLDISLLAFLVDNLPYWCICVFRKNQRWENTGISIEKRKSKLLINTRTLLDMPYSTLCSLLLMPLPSSNLVLGPFWPSVIFLTAL